MAKSTISVTARRSLEQAKQGSVGQLLLKCARLLDEAAIVRANREEGFPRLRPVHTKLFPHIDFEGTRLVDLAQRLGVTKQAVGPWVAELSEMNVVELVPDAEDGRAKRVRFTAHGARAIHRGLGILRVIEGELADHVGEKRLATLRATLTDLVPVLEGLASDSAGSPPPGTAD